MMEDSVEFGYAVQVSCDEEGSIQPYIKEIAKAELKRHYQNTKSQYFPDFIGEPTHVESYVITNHTLARKDGEEIPDDVYDRWSEWYFQDEDADPKPEDFDFGDEYYSKPVFYKGMGWHAFVPNELVQRS